MPASTSFDLADVPEDRRVRSADGKRVAAIDRHHSDDLWDHDTVYDIVVWDAETAHVIENFTRIRSLETATSRARGKGVRTVRFEDDNSLIVVYDDDTEEPAREKLSRSPEDEFDEMARRTLEPTRQHARDGDLARAAELHEQAVTAWGAWTTPYARALATLVRTEVRLDEAVDVDELLHASQALLNAADWENATSAFATLARACSRERAYDRAREAFVAAIGCAESAGAATLGPRLLVRLGELEIAASRPQHALTALHQALRRLAGVPMLGARLAEAQCHEQLGDAWEALHDWNEARRHWQDAVVRFNSIDRRADAVRVLAKFDARQA